MYIKSERVVQRFCWSLDHDKYFSVKKLMKLAKMQHKSDEYHNNQIYFALFSNPQSSSLSASH